MTDSNDNINAMMYINVFIRHAISFSIRMKLFIPSVEWPFRVIATCTKFNYERMCIVYCYEYVYSYARFYFEYVSP